MKLNKPKFWDYKKPNILSYILWPISVIIQIIHFLKSIIQHKKKYSSIKTICIGNIYLGGPGKTSLSLKIQKILEEKKIKTCFIKKYYPNQIDEQKILDILVKEQNLEIIDLKKITISNDIKSVLPSNYIKVNFVAPFKVDGKTLHIAIPDSSKLTLMRNLKAITKKNIELHAAPLSQISEFIEKISSDGEVTTATIRNENKEKQKSNLGLKHHLL